jgi:hypothetical protein
VLGATVLAAALLRQPSGLSYVGVGLTDATRPVDAHTQRLTRSITGTQPESNHYLFR